MKILSDQIKQYKTHLINEEKTKATIEKYIRDIIAFCKWLAGRELTKELVLEYKAELVENYAPASVNSILASLNGFFNYNEWHELKVKNLKIQRRIFCQSEKELTKAEYEKLLKAAKDKNKITSGTSDSTFSPDAECNLAQILTFIWRAAGEPQVNTSPRIADVNPGDYYYMAGYWAQSLGIFERALYPNTWSNRMTSVYFIWCAAGKPECKTPLEFTDTQNPKYEKYYEAIAWAVENGITNGTGETTFSPGKTCSRAEIVTFLWRAASKGLI